jgi:divalent metal cation (Fe/Co/Zn/Cd) transporter
VVIWASAAFAGYESVPKLIGHGATSHVGLGIASAALGIAGNQVVARYKLSTGKRINSATLIADARHSWLDALSSLGPSRAWPRSRPVSGGATRSRASP